MLVRARAARDLPIGDVAEQDVLKGVLRVARDCGASKNSGDALMQGNSYV